MTVRWTGLRPVGDAAGCIEAPVPGNTNAQFDIKVENLVADREAPVPKVLFKANLSPSGTVVEGIEGVDRLAMDLKHRTVTGSPALGNLCAMANGIGETHQKISAGGQKTYHGVVEAVPDPMPAGFGLLVTIFNADGELRHQEMALYQS